MDDKQTAVWVRKLAYGLAIGCAVQGAFSCSDGSPSPNGQAPVVNEATGGAQTSATSGGAAALDAAMGVTMGATGGVASEVAASGGATMGGSNPVVPVTPAEGGSGGASTGGAMGVGAAANSAGGAGTGGAPDGEVAPAAGASGMSGGAPPVVAPIADYTPIGFASVDAWGQNGTTGGYGGPTVTVSTSAELLENISKEGPYTIQIDGMISVPAGMHQVSSDKTIVGLRADSGITGGGLNIGLSITDATEPLPNAVHNVIIANLNLTGANDDCINVQMFSHHVWVHHNTFSKSGDGTLDIKRGSSYCTVSYNHFKQTRKTLLLGHSDGNGAQDVGRLKTTYHHNWFDGGRSRHPRVRFGGPHIFNNFYDNLTNYGIAAAKDSLIYSENNFCQGGRCFGGPGGGSMVDVGSVGFDSRGGAINWKPTDHYSYTADPAASVPEMVMAKAGVGKPGAMPPP